MKAIQHGAAAVASNEQQEQKIVYADVVLRAASGASIKEQRTPILSTDLDKYLPADGAMEKAEARLREFGVNVVARGRAILCVSAEPGVLERHFGVAPDANEPVVHVPEALADVVESITWSVPVVPFGAISASPPTPDLTTPYVDLPEGLARLVDALQCHDRGIDGTGVRLAMVDEGTFAHPFYKNYNVTVDESWLPDNATAGPGTGHGTTFAATALSVAPKVDFIAVRLANRQKDAVPGGLLHAAYGLKPQPDVIIADWGATVNDRPIDVLKAAEIAVAEVVGSGIVICAPCGNIIRETGERVLYTPATHPEVIAVGGTYADERDHFQASSYATSGTVPAMHPDRQMPDLTGFVGMAPYGIYLTLPCEPGCDPNLDQAFFRLGDGTDEDDGWVVASGTSAATPQVAGVACLLIQSDPRYRRNPHAVKARLMEACTDVLTGASATGETAGAGPDLATGAGVIDAYVAVNGVDVWLKDHANDTGLVPSHGDVWESPDVVVRQTLSGTEIGFDDSLQAGATYSVYVTARNRGIESASAVRVKLYYTNRLSPQNEPPNDWHDWDDGQSGVSERGAIRVGDIATNMVTLDTIPARGTCVAGPFTFTAPASGIGGRRWSIGLLARLSCDRDEPVPEEIENTYVRDVKRNNNLAMRRMTVKT